MGRYDNLVRLAEIRRLMHEKKYKKALDKLDKIDIEKLKTITDFNLITEVYINNEKYQEARQVLLKVYDKYPTRRVIYQLISLSLKTGKIEEAQELYEEYKDLDKNTCDKLILRYCIDKARGVEKQQLLAYLLQLKQEEYQEEWAYELAKLYHKMGMEEECVRECSDIILWFGEGLIVEKAKLLKLHYVEGLDILAPQSSGKKAEDNKEEEVLEDGMLTSNEGEEIVDISESDQVYTAEDANGTEVVNESEDVYGSEDIYGSEGVHESEDIYGSDNVHGSEGIHESEDVNQNEDVYVDENLNEAEELCESDDEKEYNHENESEDRNTTNDIYDSEEKYQQEPNFDQNPAEIPNHNIDKEPVDSKKENEKEQEEAQDKRIIEMLETVQSLENPVHFVLIEEDSSQLTPFVKKLVKEFYSRDILPSSQIAKISGEKLNEIDLKNSYDKLKNGCLVIQQAGDMTNKAVNQLMDMMEHLDKSIVVILEDNDDAVKWLFKKNKKLKNWFFYNIYLPTEGKDGLM